MNAKKIRTAVLSILLVILFFGCSAVAATGSSESPSTTATANDPVYSTVVAAATSNTGSESTAIDTTEQFTERDLEQTADLKDAEYIILDSSNDVTISSAGVYVLSGDVENVTVTVEADEEAKVQLVLDGVSIVNNDAPAITVTSADKVFVTTTQSENYLEVSGSFSNTGDTNYDAVIFSKDDLVLNGTGSITIISSQGNGITSKDDLKVTGGTYVLQTMADSLEANDSIRIYDGNITIVSNKDGIHCENEEDNLVGYIYIADGTFTITAADDGIRGTTIVQIDGGDITINRSTEGIESTYIQINGGTIDLYATDDGINASRKSSSCSVLIEVNGGNLSVEVGSGDTDAFDSNGNIIVNDGTIAVTASSAFDSDGISTLNGGSVTVNGSAVTQLTGGMGGPGGVRVKGNRHG